MIKQVYTNFYKSYLMKTFSLQNIHKSDDYFNQYHEIKYIIKKD